MWPNKASIDSQVECVALEQEGAFQKRRALLDKGDQQLQFCARKEGGGVLMPRLGTVLNEHFVLSTE